MVLKRLKVIVVVIAAVVIAGLTVSLLVREFQARNEMLTIEKRMNELDGYMKSKGAVAWKDRQYLFTTIQQEWYVTDTSDIYVDEDIAVHWYGVDGGWVMRATLHSD